MSGFVGTANGLYEGAIVQLRGPEFVSSDPGVRAAVRDMLVTCYHVDRNYEADPQPELLAQLPREAAFVRLGRYIRTGNCPDE